MILAACALLLAPAVAAPAHEDRPAYLEIRETTPGEYQVLWKVPRAGGLAGRLVPLLPEEWLRTSPTATYPTRDAILQRWSLQIPDGPAGAELVECSAWRGAGTTSSSTCAGSTGRSGPPACMPAAPPRRCRPTRPAGPPPAPTSCSGWSTSSAASTTCCSCSRCCSWSTAACAWCRRSPAFTVAHSITLGGASLGYLALPSAPVEAVIALSIVFLAGELLRPAEPPSMGRRHPWLVAFAFGLLHGFGFAGALAETGLPHGQVPLALLNFNLGVEAGQLLFVAAALVVLALSRRVLSGDAPLLRLGQRLPAYGIGSIAAFWTVERVVGFWA